MSTTLTIHEHGNMFTVQINSTAMGSPISASLSDRYLYAIIDGLLWWVINSKLDSMVACAMRSPAPADRDLAMEYGHSLADGEELVMHVFTTPFHDHPEERQARIVDYITRHLAKLKAMVDHGPHSAIAQKEHAELLQLCTLLADRIAHSGEAMHGITDITTHKKAA